MVIFVDNLDYVTHPKANPCLFTGDEVILHRIILELCPHIDLRKDIISQSQKNPTVAQTQHRKGLTDRGSQGTRGGQGATGGQGTSGDQIPFEMIGMLG